MKMKVTFLLPLAGMLTLLTSGCATADSKATVAKAKPYPLKTCLVSDDKFGGDMGDPHVFVHEGRQVKLCCEGCVGDFRKDPAKYVKKMEAAEVK